MEAANFIREYLYKQDYLDVPGLGTFFLSKDPFSVDNPKNKIKPSVKTLIFRENKRVSGDSLIHFIARRKQISLDEASSIVNQFTSEIRISIVKIGFADILGFGKFTSQDGVNLDFKAHPNNYSPVSFGLGELNLPPLERPIEKQSDHSSIFGNPSSPLSSFSEPIIQEKPQEKTNHEDLYKNIDNTEKVQQESKDTDITFHLPTAEELYQTYHFTPTHSPNISPEFIENNFNSPNRETESILEEKKESVLDRPMEEQSLPKNETEIKSPVPILENPLSYPSMESLRVVQPKENTATDIPHPPVFVPLDKNNEQDSEYQKNSGNFTWVWILCAFFLLATLCGLIYVEKVKFLKQIHSAFPGFKAFDFLESIPGNPVSDSTLIKHQKKVMADSLKSVALQDSIKIQDSLKNMIIQDTSSSKENLNKTPDVKDTSSKINLKTLKESGSFLVVGGDFYQPENAKRFSKKYDKRGISNFIVDAKGKGVSIEENNEFGSEKIKRPVAYFVCLGQYEDISIAELKIKELMKDPNFKGFARPYIFKNNYKTTP